VQRDGVVQAVDVPPGQGTVTWHYTPPRLFPGLALSLAGLVLTAAFALLALTPKRARLTAA
jgi:uncharacterized membrane protein YfhO